MNECIYLDNSATTKPCRSAIEGINRALSENWGNPSSLYSLGIDAESELSKARSAVAELINCRDDEIFFTSGGTESNNIAIRGAAKSGKHLGKRIITTSVEHPSVLNTVAYLEENGYEVVRIKPDNDGHFDPAKVVNAADDTTALISIMLVNNETGCIFPVKAISQAVRQKGCKAIMHTDCVQAFGKLPIDVGELGVDLLSASGHKIHGPKGIGILYKSKRLCIKPLVYGGNQEKGLRSGTESVPLIAGLAGALSELDVNKSLKQLGSLHSYAAEHLESIGAVINSPMSGILPYIINISVPGYRSENLLHFLEERNIFVSSGSACAKGKGSYVLSEMGIAPDRADSALRISFSRFSTENDIDRLCEALCEAKASLRKR